MRDCVLNSTQDFKATTFRFDTGAPIVLGGSPVVSVYPDNSATQITAGITLSVDFDSVVGLNNLRIVATVGNGYGPGVMYYNIITTGTVNSVSAVGAIFGESWSIRLGTPGLVFTGVAASGANGSVTMASPLATTADLYNGCTAVIVAGLGVGQSRLVYDSNATSRQLDVSPNWITNPDGTSVVELYATPPAGTAAAALPQVNATQVGSQTASAAGTVTFPGTIASSTNITGGTITTVTNLTNAPTAGDFTATMKTSIGTAVAASAVASVTGAVGSIASGGITAASFAANAIAEAAIASNAFTAAKFATAALPSSKFDATDPVPVNIIEVFNTVIAGAGTTLDPWGPA